MIKCFNVFLMSFCIWMDVRIFAEDKSQTFEHDFGPDSEPYSDLLEEEKLGWNAGLH